jgi:hypothetical protein
LYVGRIDGGRGGEGGKEWKDAPGREVERKGIGKEGGGKRGKGAAKSNPKNT